jgi:ketosteroid isomerase-like protein
MDMISNETRQVIERFNIAFNGHDTDAVMALMTDDCIFENTGPAPDGTRYTGQAAVRSFWETFFHANPDARFAMEEMITCGDRCVVRWRYDWGSGATGVEHVRGVDVFRVRDGKVAEKLSYVKG